MQHGRTHDRSSIRQARADSEATRAAVTAVFALIVFGAGIGLASTGRLDWIGSVVLIVVVPLTLCFVARTAARTALSHGTRRLARARFGAIVGSVWRLVEFV